MLEYATPLISEETGEVAYIFAATVDVTLFVREQVARLLATDEDYAEIDALGHAPRRRRASRRKSIQIQQKDSGVFIDPARNFSRRDLSVKASAEKMYASGPEVRIQRHDDSHNDGYESQEKGNADEGDDHESKIDWLLLDDFPVPPVTDRLPALPGNVETALQQLFAHAVTQHRHAFLLTSTATLRSSSSHKAQSGQWLVSYTSPALHKRRKDLAVALSKTEEGVLREVGEMLAGDRDVSTQIAWGVAGERRLLKAVPMMRDGRAGGGVACWLCFLLDI